MTRALARPDHAAARGRARVALLAAATLIGTIALTACGQGYGPVYPATDPTSATTGTGTGTTGANTTALVGIWRRVIFFEDATALRSSETTYNFDGAGNVTRTVVASNLTQGVADALTSAGTYTASGGRVTLRYLTPDTSTVTFDYSITTSTTGGAATLLLGGTAFTQSLQSGR